LHLSDPQHDAAGSAEANGRPFLCHGRAGALSPVVIAVPHAGRAYPDGLLAQARVPLHTLHRLEDRFADLLTAQLIALGHHVIVARTPRAMIDLNRDPREFDPHLTPDAPDTARARQSLKQRGGLGLVPSQLSGVGALWRKPLPYAALQERIARVHQPYHAALSAALSHCYALYGVALLLDVHSMPPLSADSGLPQRAPARIVIGDRFGRSADDRLSDLAVQICANAGVATALNVPYAGHYSLARHGDPARSIHALQIEIDRSLYLAADLMTPASGLAAIQTLLAALVAGLSGSLVNWNRAEAAE
jgi:N-formylglutamate amidohydrolase